MSALGKLKVKAEEIIVNNNTLKALGSRDLSPGKNSAQLTELLSRVESEGIESIDLGKYVALPVHLDQMANLFAASTTLYTVSLKKMGLGTSGIRTIAKGIECSTALQCMDLGWNDIDAAGSLRLGRALRTNQSLTELYLGGNPLGDPGACSIAKALPGTSLALLQLSFANIGPHGASALAEALGINTTLRTLELMANHIQSTGALSLVALLDQNQTLGTLGLAGNSIGANQILDDLMEELCGALQRNSSLTSLDLRENGIPLGCGEAIAQAIMKNSGSCAIHLKSACHCLHDLEKEKSEEASVGSLVML